MSRRKTWKQEWRDFTAQPPGRRFRDRHARRNSGRSRRRWWQRALNLIAGLGLVAVGAVLSVAPGPAIPFLVLGCVLIASESYWAARAVDAIDVLIAPLLQWIARRWRGLSRTARRIATGCMITGSVLAIVAGVMWMR